MNSTRVALGRFQEFPFTRRQIRSRLKAFADFEKINVRLARWTTLCIGLLVSWHEESEVSATSRRNTDPPPAVRVWLESLCRPRASARCATLQRFHAYAQWVAFTQWRGRAGPTLRTRRRAH